MMLGEFKNCKVGDTVICNTSLEHLPQKGWKGRIIYKKEENLTIGVEWEKHFILGHGCNGLGKYNYCRKYFFSFFDNSYPLDQNISILDLYKPEQLEFEF